MSDAKIGKDKPYQYNHDEDTSSYGRVGLVHKLDMKEFNISGRAIAELIKAIRDDKIDMLKNLFSKLDAKQSSALLGLYVDPNDLCVGSHSNDWLNVTGPMGIPVDLAKAYGHEKIAKYLTELETTLAQQQKTVAAQDIVASGEEEKKSKLSH